VEAERAFSAAGIFTTKLRSRFSDNSIDTLCFLRSFYLRAKPKCNYINHSEVQTVVQTILSLFSGLILLVKYCGTFNFELIKFIKTTENTISA